MFPGCSFTFNSLKSFGMAGADYVEQHDPDVAMSMIIPCFFNNDGHTILFDNQTTQLASIHASQLPDMAKRFDQCKSVFLWHHSYNCITPSRFVDPRRRSCSDTENFLRMGDAASKLQ